MVAVAAAAASAAKKNSKSVLIHKFIRNGISDANEMCAFGISSIIMTSFSPYLANMIDEYGKLATVLIKFSANTVIFTSDFLSVGSSSASYA